MKSKGYTLIELIAALAVVSVITAVAFPKIEASRDELIDRDLEEETIRTVEFLNWSKAYARRFGSDGSVVISDDKTISFKLGRTYIDGYNLCDNVSFGTNYLKLFISKFGAYSGSCSIFLISSSGKSNQITIKVGTGYVSRKK